MVDSPVGGGSLHNSASSSDAILDTRKVTLNDLVGTFLAAKRSLQCIDLVVRAREIVELGRVYLEENAVLSAGNSFVRCAAHGQLDTLGGIRYGGKSVDAEGHQELQVRILSALTRL
jgi:autophagy-related protein 17